MADFRLRMIGERAAPGRATLRIRSDVDDSGFRCTRVFAVLHDGSEVEIEDCVRATWDSGGGERPARATISVEGVELQADFQARAAVFGIGNAVWSNEPTARIAEPEPVVEAVLIEG